MLVANLMKWLMSWRTRAVPLTKNLSFLGHRSMDPCYSVSGSQCAIYLKMRTWVISYPETERPIKLLKSVTAVNTMRAAKLRSTIFVREALLRPDASVIRKIIAKYNDPTVKCLMRMMSEAYPVNAYLYRIKKVKSPNGTFCDRGDRETISRFLKMCRKFHHARIAAHNWVRQVLFKLLQKHSLADGKLVEETPMYLTGLHLQEVPTAEVQQAGRAVQDSQIQGGQMSLGRWQPDIVCILLMKKKIAKSVSPPTLGWRPSKRPTVGRLSPMPR